MLGHPGPSPFNRYALFNLPLYAHPNEGKNSDFTLIQLFLILTG